MIYETCLVLSVLLTIHIQYSTACNGYSLKLNKISTCVDNSVIQIENPGAVLDKDCNLILTGCVTTVGFKTSKGTYSLKKAPMPPLQGDMDFCEAAANLNEPQVDKLAKMYNVPRKCPIPAGKICGANDKKINISKYKNQLGIAAGTVEARIEAEHDTGKTCLDLNLTLSKAKSRG